MRAIRPALFLLLWSALAAPAAPVILARGALAFSAGGREVVDLSAPGAVEAAAAATGLKVGWFPALADYAGRAWVPVFDGDLAAAEARLAETLAARGELEADARPAAQKLLENEYFGIVDALYAAAGEEAPALADAKDPSKVRAKAAKARSDKDKAAGQGKSAKADDLLELTELRLRLLSVDAELKAIDPGWLKNAKRHADAE